MFIGAPPGPAWLAAHPAINEWFAIANTSGAGSSKVDNYSGFALKVATSELFIPAAGGHPDLDNRVVSLNLALDAPGSVGTNGWVLRHAQCASPNEPAADDDSYNASDGTPMAAHLYNYLQHVASLDKVILIGSYGIGAVARVSKHVNGFGTTTFNWDAAGTWADPASTVFGRAQDASGVIYCDTSRKFTPATNTWGTHPHTLGRFPIAYDSSNNTFFSLQWGDGQGAGSGVTATRANLGAGTDSTITFNTSAALTQFATDTPIYSGMDYDPINDNFLYYCGQGSGAGRIYVITKGVGTVWDMSILALGGGSVTPNAAISAGVNKRFQYVSALRGFVMLPYAASNLYFIRTS